MGVRYCLAALAMTGKLRIINNRYFPTNARKKKSKLAGRSAKRRMK